MKRTLITAVAVLLIGLPGFAPTASAQYFVHQDHFLTFDNAIALPNGVTLPAGTYLFRFPDRNQRGMTQIVSEDRSKVYAMLQTIPVIRNKTQGFDIVLEKTSADTPPTIKAWYCEGNRYGHQFVAVKK